MDERLKTIIAEELMFAKEAAAYLGISVQRLNKLMHKGEIQPVKRSPSGTLFLKRDLDERRYTSGNIGREIPAPRNVEPMRNNGDKIQEAINYFSIQSFFDYAYGKTQPHYQKLRLEYDFKKPLFYHLEGVSAYLGVPGDEFVARYEQVLRGIEKLLATDEILSLSDEAYPFELKRTASPPPFLFLRGHKELLNQPIASVIGVKEPTFPEKELAYRITRHLAERGYVIASGLAKGVDTVVLDAAVNNRIPSIAVLGTPLNRAYPKENENLQRDISRDGLLLSQYCPSAPGKRWQFPIRGITLSGISQFTILVDQEYMEGNYKQIEYTLHQGRVVFMPYPVKITRENRWLERYINRKGIILYRDYEDFLRQLKIVLG